MKKALIALMAAAQCGWTADLHVVGKITATGDIKSGNMMLADGKISAQKQIESQHYIFTPGHLF